MPQDLLLFSLNGSTYPYFDFFVFFCMEPSKFCCILKVNYKLCLLYVDISHHGTIYMYAAIDAYTINSTTVDTMSHISIS